MKTHFIKTKRNDFIDKQIKTLNTCIINNNTYLKNVLSECQPNRIM